MKGGEKVEIGGLGFFNTMASVGKEGSQTSTDSGFSGMFGLLLSGLNPSTEGLTLESSKNEISKGELLELIKLLKSEDILEIDGGFELLKQSIPTEVDSELLPLFESFLANGTSLKDLLGFSHQGEQVNELLTGINNKDLTDVKLEDLLMVLTQIASLPLEDLKQALNSDMKEVIKTIKFLELLSSEKGFNSEEGRLKDLVQQLTKKLELLAENGTKGTVDTGKQASRLEYLQKTFSVVAAELSTHSSKADIKPQVKPVQVSLETVNGFIQFQQLSKAEQLTLTLSQPGNQTTSADLIKQFENILARSQFSNVVGSQKLLIKLNPEHLGALRIELIQRDAGLVAKILTTTKIAKETLESHINGLKHAFGSQNIQVDRVEVSQSMSQQQERFLSRDQQQSQQQHSQEEQENHRHDGDGLEEQSFNFSLEEALVNTEA